MRHHEQAHITSGAHINCSHLWPWDEHRQQQSLVDNFAGQCCLRQVSSPTTFVAATLGLPTNLQVEKSWLFPASSIKLLTRGSMKSRWVYLAPHEDKRIQLLSTVSSRRCKNRFQGSSSIVNLHSISDRSEQNSSKLRKTVCDPFMGRLVSLQGSPCDTFMGRLAAKVTCVWWWIVYCACR